MNGQDVLQLGKKNKISTLNWQHAVNKALINVKFIKNILKFIPEIQTTF